MANVRERHACSRHDRERDWIDKEKKIRERMNGEQKRIADERKERLRREKAKREEEERQRAGYRGYYNY